MVEAVDARAGLAPPAARSWAAACLAAYVVFHHLGTVAGPLGTLGVPGGGDRGWAGTRWADWLDLLTPFAVLGSAAVALAAARAQRRTWFVFGIGALLYVEGHGIHLAANSVSNVAPGPTAHLWDEVVGHYLWYGGVFLVFFALVRSVGREALPRGRGALVGPFVLAVLAGATAGTNALEGGTVAFTAAAAVAGLVHGVRRRGQLAWLLVPAGLIALTVLAGWGLWAGGFPQPSEVGVPPG